MELGIVALNVSTLLAILFALIVNRGRCCPAVSAFLLSSVFLLGQSIVFIIANYAIGEYVRQQVLVSGILGNTVLAHLLGLILVARAVKPASKNQIEQTVEDTGEERVFSPRSAGY